MPRDGGSSLCYPGETPAGLREMAARGRRLARAAMRASDDSATRLREFTEALEARAAEPEGAGPGLSGMGRSRSVMLAPSRS
jgi:hypothetical protein